MRLRTALVLYLGALHVALAALAARTVTDWRWFLAVELVLIASVLVAVRLVGALMVPLRLVRTGTELIREGDFTCTFQEVGHPEMDELVAVYNSMIRRLREERLHGEERQLFLQRILDASPIAVLTLDLDGAVATANPTARALLGEGLVGGRLAELPGTLGAVLAGLSAGEDRLVAVAGRRFRCQRGSFHDRGFRRGFLLVEELTEELRRAERAAYERVIRTMSHEVNNSMAAVGSLLESGLGLTGLMPPQRRESFAEALRAALGRIDHLRSFMEAFAEVVRLPDPVRRPCDLDRLVADLVRLLGPQLGAEGRRLEIALPSPLGTVDADPHQLEQVLLNIIRNAAEASPAGTAVTICGHREHGRAVLEILDEGPALAPEIRRRIFTPFFSTKADGRGVGLTLVAEVLQRHGFDYDLEPRPEGGSRFRISFDDGGLGVPALAAADDAVDS